MCTSSVEFFKQLNVYGFRFQVSGFRYKVEFQRIRSKVGLGADRYFGLRKLEIGEHPAFGGTLLAQTVQFI